MKEIVQKYKALADETRLRIIALLLDQGELCVCEILAALGLPQSTVSRHLAILRNSGWVDDRRNGLWVYYKVRGGDPFQQELAALLKKQLPGTKTSKSDRSLLATLDKDNHCS